MNDAADVGDADATKTPKKGKLGLILGLVGGLVLGGGGFYAVYSGMFDPAGLMGSGHEAGHATEGYAFVPMEPIMISLPPGSSARHLRFLAQLEVAPEHTEEVRALLPRVVDTLNTYLRAVEVRDLEDPAALARLRAQMLRRVQIVTGEGRVLDLLVTEFVLS